MTQPVIQQRHPTTRQHKVELESIYETTTKPEDWDTPIARAFNSVGDTEPITKVELIQRRQKPVGEDEPFPGSK